MTAVSQSEVNTSRDYVNSLPGGDEFDYASDFLGWYVEGGRKPEWRKFNLTEQRASEIRQAILSRPIRNR